jgi:hypothetical protein
MSLMHSFNPNEQSHSEMVANLYERQLAANKYALTWLRLFSKVKTPEGWIGEVVELKAEDYNGLYVDHENRLKAVVWFGTNHEEAKFIWSTYSLYELSPGPINSSVKS